MDRTSRKSTMWKISPDGKKRQQITGHHDGFYRYLAVSLTENCWFTRHWREKAWFVIMPAGGGKSLALAISREDHYEAPAWSPDGKRLALPAARTGKRGPYIIMEIDTGKVKEDLKQLNR